MPMVSPGLTNLLSWWKMDEVSGVRSDSHSSIDLSDYNTVGSNAGKVNNAASFVAGNSEGLYTTNSSYAVNGSTSFSIAFWMKTPDTNLAYIVSRWDSGLSYLLFKNGGNLSWFTRSTGGAFSGVGGIPHSINSWNFIVIWFDIVDKISRVQVDNSTIYEAGSPAVDIDTTPASFALGFRGIFSPDVYYQGEIDEFCFYNKALSADEREWLYNSGNGRSYSDLVSGQPVGLRYSFNKYISPMRTGRL